MSSVFGHALAGATLSAAFLRDRAPRRAWLVAAACAAAPDLDWFTRYLGTPEAGSLAHRGLSHSLIAAVLIAALGMATAFRGHLRSPRHWACLLSAALSHGILDALTFGGTGVAFLLPFSETRFVCVWQPLFVSPIPLSGRLVDWFLFSLGTELVWIGLPAALVFAVPALAARLRRLRAPTFPPRPEERRPAEEGLDAR